MVGKGLEAPASTWVLVVVLVTRWVDVVIEPGRVGEVRVGVFGTQQLFLVDPDDFFVPPAERPLGHSPRAVLGSYYQHLGPGPAHFAQGEFEVMVDNVIPLFDQVFVIANPCLVFIRGELPRGVSGSPFEGDHRGTGPLAGPFDVADEGRPVDPRVVSQKRVIVGVFETFYNDPQGISVGLIPTAKYYNSTDTLDGYFAGFIAAPDGEILVHFDPELIGTDIEDLLGPAVRNATAEGAWITADDNPAEAAGPQTMRIWVINVDGTLIGGGWYNDGSD